MISVTPLSNRLLEEIISAAERRSMDFFEYSFIPDDELKAYLKSELNDKLSANNSFIVVAIERNRPAGFISIKRNDFDSQFFGFPCFQYMIQLYTSFNITEVVRSLINEAETFCSNISSEYYVYLSLNNNAYNTQAVMNSLLRENYFFINTLLTFALTDKRYLNSIKPEGKITIRLSKPEDADAVSRLAERSFNYSRFHLDPFLDNEKANQLLKISAENSILRGFADVMFVAEINKRLVGYYSGKKNYIKDFNKTFGSAIISAVDPEFQGMGIFTQMDNYLLDWFSKNCDFAEMGTYLANYPVHKTWIGKNLKLIRGTYQLSKLVSNKK